VVTKEGIIINDITLGLGHVRFDYAVTLALNYNACDSQGKKPFLSKEWVLQFIIIIRCGLQL
jgi:hypothetical protein